MPQLPSRQIPILLAMLASCGGTEATEVFLETQVEAPSTTIVTNNLGYSIEVTAARTALANIEFTTEGEEHENVVARAWNWLVPTAHAHPGHSAGGTITGELRGDYIVDWLADSELLGTARLLTGNYEGANFALRAASASDGLDAQDPLLGHTAHVVLSVSRDGTEWQADVRIDTEPDTSVIGATLEREVAETTTEALRFGLLTEDPTSGETLFDDLDFAALDTDADGQIDIAPGDAAHNQLRRRLTSHAFYVVR